jgi:hypothetical protein
MTPATIIFLIAMKKYNAHEIWPRLWHLHGLQNDNADIMHTYS